MLKRQAYDLALVDYHLPELDGYASARLMREVAHGGPVLKLVAFTADRDGLMARSGAEAVFDAILTSRSSRSRSSASSKRFWTLRGSTPPRRPPPRHSCAAPGPSRPARPPRRSGGIAA